MLEIDVCLANSKRSLMMKLLEPCQEISPALWRDTNEIGKVKPNLMIYKRMIMLSDGSI